MNADEQLAHKELAAKIARLVEERGWNQEDFVRITSLNRMTVRLILQGKCRRMRNTTVQACARALSLTVSELRTLPLERLLPRMHAQARVPSDDRLRHILAQATRPELMAWLQRNDDRARSLSLAEADELLGLQGDDGPIAALGVDRVVELLERKRELLSRVKEIAGTEYLGLLEQIVALLYDRIRISHG